MATPAKRTRVERSSSGSRQSSISFDASTHSSANERIDPETNTNIYQFKVLLKGLKVWRRIQVPGYYNFHELHIDIQKAMGWQSVRMDYHLHQFEVLNLETGERETIGHSGCFETNDENERYICHYFKTPTKGKADRATYLYDFGDSWHCELIFEKILEPDGKFKYPRCVTGRKFCPPEDPPPYDEDEEDDYYLDVSSEVTGKFNPKTVFTKSLDFILQFKITLEGSNPQVWRVIQIPDTCTVYDLHEAVKTVMGYKEDADKPNFKLITTVRQVVKVGAAVKQDMADKEPAEPSNSKQKATTAVRYAEKTGKPIRIERNSSLLAFDTFWNTEQKACHRYRDGWTHEVVLSAKLKPEATVKYPRCVDGCGASPLEEWGSVEVYNELVKVLNDVNHPERAAKMEWLKVKKHSDFDAAKFNKEDFF